MPAARKILTPAFVEGGICLGSIACDKFADSNGTLLESHAPDVGGSWVKYDGVGYTIQGNRANTAWNNGNGILETTAITTTLSTGVAVAVKIYRNQFNVDQGGPGVSLRVTSAATLNFVIAEATSATEVRLKLWQKVNNGFTTITTTGSFDFVDGAELRVEITGSDYEMYYDDVSRGSGTTTAGQSQKVYGLVSQVVDCDFDDFRIVEL